MGGVEWLTMGYVWVLGVDSEGGSGLFEVTGLFGCFVHKCG